MVHSDFQTVDPEGRVIEASVERCRKRKRVSGYVFQELFMDSFIVANSVLIRRECFDRVGLFDETLRIGDYHMWLRIARHYKIDYTRQVLTTYRPHATQDSRRYMSGNPNQEPAGSMAIRSILELYPEVRQELGEGMIRRRMASQYFQMAYGWFFEGHRGRCAGRTAKGDPVVAHESAVLHVIYSKSSSAIHVTCLRKVWHAVRGMAMSSRRSQVSRTEPELKGRVGAEAAQQRIQSGPLSKKVAKDRPYRIHEFGSTERSFGIRTAKLCGLEENK